jgi:ABC-2 type transport system permease protein
MNTQANATPESFDAQGIAPAVLAATRPFYWSVRRELWENRSIYMAPLAAGGLFLFGFLISLIGLPHKMRLLSTLDPEHQRHVITMPYHFAAGLLMATALIVSVFYSLDALYGERRDRSILFWKSLPVSDFTTVLTKAGIAIVLMPLIAFAITAPLQFVMLLLSSAVVAESGQSVATLWTQVAWFQMSLMLLYHLVTIHILWHAPIYSWLLLVSGWARRAAFLWAFLPPLAICVVEKIAFNTTYFAKLLGNRLAGGPEAMSFPEDGLPIDPGMHLTPGHFLMSPGLWLGLGVAAIFLAAAVRMRRERGPL